MSHDGEIMTVLSCDEKPGRYVWALNREGFRQPFRVVRNRKVEGSTLVVLKGRKNKVVGAPSSPSHDERFDGVWTSWFVNFADGTADWYDSEGPLAFNSQLQVVEPATPKLLTVAAPDGRVIVVPGWIEGYVSIGDPVVVAEGRAVCITIRPPGYLALITGRVSGRAVVELGGRNVEVLVPRGVHAGVGRRGLVDFTESVLVDTIV